MKPLHGRTIIITGASRGIGREIALKCAADGANIVVAAKTAEPHPKLEGTIFSVAKEVEAAGGKALSFQMDVRNENEVSAMIEKTVETFGGIDALINNAGAISLTSTPDTPIKRFDLMHGVNVRAVFLCSQAALPYLRKSSNAHILNLSPPISIEAKWLAPHLGYTLSKFGMSMCTLGMAAEFRNDGISVNSLWPKTVIETAALTMLMGGEGSKHARKPSIMADAAYCVLKSPPLKVTGRLLLDEEILKENGITDFAGYACHPGEPLIPDLFL